MNLPLSLLTSFLFCFVLIACDNYSEQMNKRRKVYTKKHPSISLPAPPEIEPALTQRDIQFTNEIFKVRNLKDQVNYQTLDTLLAHGVDVNLVYTQRYIHKTLSGHIPVIQDFVDKHDTSFVEVNALAVACDAYGDYTSEAKRLIAYLLKKGANPYTNFPSLETALYKITRKFSYQHSGYSDVKWVVQCFKKHGYDMSILDLSPSRGHWSVFKYLKKEGVRLSFNMEYLDREQTRNFHRHRRELKDITLNFNGITYKDFYFDIHAQDLRYFLELGLPPDYINKANYSSNHACLRVLEQFEKLEKKTEKSRYTSTHSTSSKSSSTPTPQKQHSQHGPHL